MKKRENVFYVSLYITVGLYYARHWFRYVHTRNGKHCIKEKINDLEMNSRNRNIRDLYQGIAY